MFAFLSATRTPLIEALRWFLLQCEFAGAAAATLTFYNGEVESFSVTDSGGVYSVTGGELVPSGAAAGVGDPALRSNAPYNWKGGRAIAARVKVLSSIGGGTWNFYIAFDPNTELVNPSAFGFNTNDVNPTNWRYVDLVGALPIAEAFALDTYYVLTVIQRPGGGTFGFVDKKLVWVGSKSAPGSPLYAFITNRKAGGSPGQVDYYRLHDFPAPFDTDYGLAVINQANPVSGTDYTGSADGIIDAMITAPNPLAGTTGIYYRHVDNNNTWDTYTDSTSGRGRLDSVDGGVRTNRISVNTVWADGTTVTVRAIYTGQLHDLYTLSGSTWAKRGAQINVSVGSNNNTNVAAHIGGSYTVANLRQYDRNAASYSVLDATLA